MPSIHFQAVIGPEQIIRPPQGVNIPEGLIEVVVQTPDESREGNEPKALREWLLEVASESERVAPELPADLAECHDRYAHGKPLP